MRAGEDEPTQAAETTSDSTPPPPPPPVADEEIMSNFPPLEDLKALKLKKQKQREAEQREIEGGQRTAIFTGALSIILGVAYIALDGFALGVVAGGRRRLIGEHAYVRCCGECPNQD